MKVYEVKYSCANGNSGIVGPWPTRWMAEEYADKQNYLEYEVQEFEVERT